ncbi:hypothetical protein GCM10008018_37050 [Paenibacillus marchantiophytorum]|uniref:Uncharacterized protein n=1 Tax=Paenibacillus marchantiophytorum TaxID=1619310 RepID=A0ABQ1EU21_9BACL|nr:hypothetical protein [Paenibacillus marchantiophytorum]GFZ87459.1 hypothetical protein GCM10008018_37050 [Paenibacillus marchantiophytorum]
MKTSTIELAMLDQAASVSEMILVILQLINGLLLRYPQADERERFLLSQSICELFSSMSEVHRFHQRKYLKLSQLIDKKGIVEFVYFNEIKMYSDIISKRITLIARASLDEAFRQFQVNVLNDLQFIDNRLAAEELNTNLNASVSKKKGRANVKAAPPLLLTNRDKRT